MIYESPIELINHYSNIDKIDDIATVLFESDDDMFYDEQDREECRSEAIPRIAKAIRSIPRQLSAITAKCDDAIARPIALVPIHKYDTQQIPNSNKLGEGDDWTYRICRRWETYCFDIDSLDKIPNYLESRPVVESIDDLSSVTPEAWDGSGFVLGSPDFIMSRTFATAPVIIDDTVDGKDELEAIASVINVIAMYGFDLERGDSAKKADIKHIEEALNRINSGEEKTYPADECLKEIMKAHGLKPKPEEAIKRDNAITMESVWREFAYETEFVRTSIAPIAEEIHAMALSK